MNYERCSGCGGAGTVPVVIGIMLGITQFGRATCQTCGGSGKLKPRKTEEVTMSPDTQILPEPQTLLVALYRPMLGDAANKNSPMSLQNKIMAALQVAINVDGPAEAKINMALTSYFGPKGLRNAPEDVQADFKQGMRDVLVLARVIEKGAV